MVVNQKELAQCLGISTRQVRNLREEGLFQTVEKERGYKLENCIKEYIEFKINAEVGRGHFVSKEKVQAEHEEIKKQISILKLRKLKRELHEARDVEYFLTNMLIHFKSSLLEIPIKIAMEITGESDINKVSGIIQKNLIQVVETLEVYDPDRIDGKISGEDEAEEEDETEEG